MVRLLLPRSVIHGILLVVVMLFFFGVILGGLPRHGPSSGERSESSMPHNNLAYEIEKAPIDALVPANVATATFAMG